MTADFLAHGWAKFERDAGLATWIGDVTDTAMATAGDSSHAHWHRHQNTWFAGVNVLKYDRQGRVANGAPLCCRALDVAAQLYGNLPLGPAQVSITYPGYPKQDDTESDAAHRFRKNRDAAHVDGLNAQGTARRRFLNETHGYILGLPLGTSTRAPLVVWDKSHEVMRAAFRTAFRDIPPKTWPSVDLTDIYKTTRRKVFETCQRIELPVTSGEATLVHRLTVHGVAPWGPVVPGGGPRAILYFRPELPGGAPDWLDLP